jgi:hypothetical protein
MEFVNGEARGLAMATINDSNEPVYKSTTVPIERKKSNVDRNPSLKNNFTSDLELQIRPFQNLPAREPVDIQFKDVTYTVSVGFRKGESVGILREENVCRIRIDIFPGHMTI